MFQTILQVYLPFRQWHSRCYVTQKKSSTRRIESDQMLVLLHILCISDYELRGPFVYNSTGEFGTWTMMGQGAVMRHSVRFTGTRDSRASGLCQRIPTIFKDWTFGVNATIHSHGHKSASLLCTYFTTDVCPIEDEIDSGFSVCISGHNPQDYSHSVFLLVGAERDGDLEPVCRLPAKRNTLFSLKRTEDEVTMVDENTGEICFSRDIPGLPELGYFALSVNGNSPTFSTDVSEISLNNLSVALPVNLSVFDKTNRKVFSQNLGRRDRLKRSRRAKMEAIGTYLHQQNEANRTLDGEGELRDVFLEIAEMRRRGKQTLDMSGLNVLIQAAVYSGIKSANRKLDTSAELLAETRLEFLGLVNMIKSELGTVRTKYEAELARLRADAEELVMSVANSDDPVNSILFKAAVKQHLNIRESNPIAYVYIGIVITECVGFIAFTLYKRKITRSFTKRD